MNLRQAQKCYNRVALYYDANGKAKAIGQPSYKGKTLTAMFTALGKADRRGDYCHSKNYN